MIPVGLEGKYQGTKINGVDRNFFFWVVGIFITICRDPGGGVKTAVIALCRLIMMMSIYSTVFHLYARAISRNGGLMVPTRFSFLAFLIRDKTGRDGERNLQMGWIACQLGARSAVKCYC